MPADPNLPLSVEEAIERNAKGPASSSFEGMAVTQHGLANQIEADRYLAGKTARAKNHFGLTLVKLEAPGAG